MLQTANLIVDRLRNYAAATISSNVAEHDAMLVRDHPNGMTHYLSVGRSAVEVIARALIATGKTEITSVLDLPCGAGRVTRHLSAFLPEAALFCGDLDKQGEAFVVETFGARPIVVTTDFGEAPPRQFDLIFVGSLVTHFDALLFARAVRWFIAALAPGGLLILTTHGRQHDHIERTLHHYIDPAKWDSVSRSYAESGFGFVAYDGQKSYGVSLSAPSWLMRLVETDASVRIVGFEEAAWDAHQDVLVLQKRPVGRETAP
jgi:SAM-dependent methyltransferase